MTGSMAAAAARPRPRPRVTEFYSLALSQWQVDFVDVDILGDTRVYIDPTALRRLPTEWGHDCVSLIQDFFKTVIDAIKDGKHNRARLLLRGLREPNETRLGLSRGWSRGRGVGGARADDIWNALAKSKAVQTGLLVDLEDTLLLVERIGYDVVSDIATNLIREPLIDYTQDACRRYGIPMVEGQLSGPLWDPGTKQWTEGRYVKLPSPNGRRLILVPKVVVRRRMEYDRDEFLRDYIFEFLRGVEIDAKSSLVQLLKSGPRVTNKDLAKKYGRSKSLIVEIARDHPELLAQYRDKKLKSRQTPLQHEDFSNLEDAPQPDWDGLIKAIRDIEPGTETATKYHRAVGDLLNALFYPWLSKPTLELRIHDGRKRIDITYWNSATSGFFDWLGRRHPASHIFVECKNYNGDPGNPELDQLSGRFSPNRGTVGFLVCRRFEDKEEFIKRCRDTANDQRGFVIPIDDVDLAQLVDARKDPDFAAKISDFLKARWDRLVM